MATETKTDVEGTADSQIATKRSEGDFVQASLWIGSAIYSNAIASASDPLTKLGAAWVASVIPTEDLRRILAIAEEAFDDPSRAILWLQEPNLQTGNKPPIALIGTGAGFETVESILRQIQYGVIG